MLISINKEAIIKSKKIMHFLEKRLGFIRLIEEKFNLLLFKNF